MAVRENQGLQIALIVFVMLTIILIVTTFLFFRSYKEEQEKGKSLASKNSELESSTNKAKEESAKYKEMIGAASGDGLEAVDAATKKDMESKGKTLPEGKQNYRELANFLSAELAAANTRITEQTAQAKKLSEQIENDQTNKKAEVAKYTDTVDTTSKDLAGVRQEFDKDRKEINSGKDQLAKKFDAKRLEFEELTKKSSQQVSSLTADNTKVRNLLQNMNDEKLRKQKLNEIPDGKISWVDQRTRMVWVNVGSQDGLRKQNTFTVYDIDDSNPADAKSKGTIEVIQVTGSHMAEARIVDDLPGNPLMPGDHIFSPTWEPGRAEHFALAGFMDIDGDGGSDRERIHELIHLGGGVIDEEVTDDGKKSGQMSIKTKYLVLGDEPRVGENASKDANISAFSEINGEARTLGVKIVPVDEFLKYMGYKQEDRTVTLGKNAKPADFKPRLPEGIQRVRPSDEKKDRRKPPATTGKSAF